MLSPQLLYIIDKFIHKIKLAKVLDSYKNKYIKSFCINPRFLTEKQKNTVFKWEGHYSKFDRYQDNLRNLEKEYKDNIYELLEIQPYIFNPDPFIDDCMIKYVPCFENMTYNSIIILIAFNIPVIEEITDCTDFTKCSGINTDTEMAFTFEHLGDAIYDIQFSEEIDEFYINRVKISLDFFTQSKPFFVIRQHQGYFFTIKFSGKKPSIKAKYIFYSDYLRNRIVNYFKPGYETLIENL